MMPEPSRASATPALSSSHAQPSGSPASRPRVEGEREADILDATLELLSSAGYDRLTMDAVAGAARASKATLYRRWTSKAELVVDALDRARGAPALPEVDTGSLRGDLLASSCDKHGLSDDRTRAVMASVITALHHDTEFCSAFLERIVTPKLAVSRSIFERARARGEVATDADLDLLAPALAAMVLHRSFVLKQPVDDSTVARLVDCVILPAARHGPCPDTG